MPPGRMVSKLVPTEEICFSIWTLAPSPIDIMTITDATPMMMPSMVSSERSGLENSASAADVVATPSFMSGSVGVYRRVHVSGPGIRIDVIRLDLAVPEMDLALGVLGDLRLVGDQHDGDPL